MLLHSREVPRGIEPRLRPYKGRVLAADTTVPSLPTDQVEDCQDYYDYYDDRPEHEVSLSREPDPEDQDLLEVNGRESGVLEHGLYV